MNNHWNLPDIPHKGWRLLDVIDIREDGQSVEDTEYETCMMCGNDRIRFVHIVEHDEMHEEFKVGCDCAEKMTNDYVNPGKLERNLRNRAVRRSKWISKEWHVNEKGNQYLKKDYHFFLIFKDKKSGKFKCKIDDIWGENFFNTVEEAKAATFNGIDYLKEKEKW
ncbi:hypothetical protein [Ferruginibacter profundus]|nr:hypothetical protein [Bacteroidota bacterium]